MIQHLAYLERHRADIVFFHQVLLCLEKVVRWRSSCSMTQAHRHRNTSLQQQRPGYKGFYNDTLGSLNTLEISQRSYETKRSEYYKLISMWTCRNPSPSMSAHPIKTSVPLLSSMLFTHPTMMNRILGKHFEPPTVWPPLDRADMHAF